MSGQSKEEAYRKLDQMNYNVGWDEWIEDDNRLNQWVEEENQLNSDMELQHFKNINPHKKQDWAQLLKQTPETNFTRGGILTVNAWYEESRNRFYLPLGIVQPPLFNINYPT